MTLNLVLKIVVKITNRMELGMVRLINWWWFWEAIKERN